MAITNLSFEIPRGTPADALFNRVANNPNRLQTLRAAVLASAQDMQQGVDGTPLPAPLKGAKWNDPGDQTLAPPDPPRKWNVIWAYPAGPWDKATYVSVTNITAR
jgi:hypothetical protein